MSLQEDLLNLLTKFNRGQVTVLQLQAGLERLVNAGLRDAFSNKQRERFNEFYIWYADQYDEKLQPRTGFLGRIKDIWMQVTKGEYRVALSDLQKKAKELETFLLTAYPKNRSR